MFANLFKRKPKREEVDKLREEVRHSSALKRLKDSPEWADLLLIKADIQEHAGRDAVNPLSDDKARFKGACDFALMDYFFKEFSRRIRAGEEANEKLKELVRK